MEGIVDLTFTPKKASLPSCWIAKRMSLSAKDKAVYLSALVVEQEMVNYIFECLIKGQTAYQMMKPV